jgi:beta-galactosidase GanA
MLQSVEPLRKTDPFTPVAPTNASIRLDALKNPDTNTQFYVLRHNDASSKVDDKMHLTINSPDGNYTVPQKADSSIEINGQESKVLISNYDIGSQHLVYSTSELMTTTTNGNRDTAIFYAKQGQEGETVLRYQTEPKVTVLSGVVSTDWDQNSGDLRLNYKHDGEAKVLIRNGDHEFLLLLETDTEAAKFWRQDTPQGPVLEKGAYLVRSAEINGDTLELEGDTKDATSLEVYAPSTVKNITWNGKKVQVDSTDSGSLTCPLAGLQAVQLPELSNWRFHYESPEAQPNFDDRDWTAADHTTTNSPVKPLSLPVLYEDDYGFHHGNVWFRGHFEAQGGETGIKLNGDGGANSVYSVWVNGAFLGSASGTQTFNFPKDLLNKGVDNVISVVLQNMGHDEDGGTNDAHKNPRGFRQAVLQGTETPIEWKIQGNTGGEDLVDSERGAFNIGGLYGERNGWNLPGFPDGNWDKVSLPNKWSDSGLGSGIGWYRTSFDLNLPKESDVPIGLRLSDDPTHKYRAFIYVNGWLMGQYINNLGPQHVFSLPAGILNPNGHNEIAIAVWGLDQDGARLGNVSLEALGNYDGGVPIEQVKSKGFSADKYGAPVLPDNVAFSLTSDKELIQENDTVRVQGKITNQGQTPILQSNVKLNVPKDWTVKPLSETDFTSIKPGETKTIEWEVTSSSTLNPDDTQIAGLVDFRIKNQQEYTSAIYSYTVPLELRPSFYLSELDWESAVSGWNSVQKDSSVGGNIITLLNGAGSNVTYQQGLGTHANSEIDYNIAGKGFKKFESYVGVDREDTKGSVTFQVWLDNQKVWDSGLMTGSTPEKLVDIDLAGANKLGLIVTDSGNGNGHDHADWADAQIINK